jgi:hypothetical protein
VTRSDEDPEWGPLKDRDIADTRRVPIPPRLVDLLRDHDRPAHAVTPPPSRPPARRVLVVAPGGRRCCCLPALSGDKTLSVFLDIYQGVAPGRQDDGVGNLSVALPS